jgi:cytoskeletal protein CcmA (bactofilin family)
MFGRARKGDGMPKISDEVNAFLGQGTEFQGQLKFDGTVRIDGTCRGEIHATGTLVVGEGGRVEAEVQCGTLIVHGEVVGNVQASHRVEALAPAKMTGNIQTPVLVINEGVVFEGNVRMEPSGDQGGERDRKISFFGKKDRRAPAEELPQADAK